MRLLPALVAAGAFALVFSASPVAIAETPDVRLNRLLDRIDDLWRGQSSKSRIRMEVKTAHYKRSMRMDAWSRGKDNSLVKILYPKKEKGTATLKAGKHLYTYLPRTDRTIRLTSAMMSGSWMGSHFTNDDLVKQSRLREDFNASITFEGERSGIKVIEITLIPKPDAAVVWGKIVSTLTANGEMPISHLYYDEDGAVARTMVLDDVKMFGKREMPAHMRIVPADKPGEYTDLTYEQIDFDVDLSESFFSLSRLRRK